MAHLQFRFSNYAILCVTPKGDTTVKPERNPVSKHLFIPIEHGYDYKAIATNKNGASSDVLLFHHGRSSQERLFGEAQQHAALYVIPTRRSVGDQVFTLAGMLAHNLGRELQMAPRRAGRGDLEKRPAKWEFDSVGTIRQHLLHSAGTLTR